MKKLPFVLGPLLLSSSLACAQRAPFESSLVPDQGKFGLAGGFANVDGVGGGGLVPFALITGYGTSDSFGANVHITDVPLRDFRFISYGASVGLFNRLEISANHDRFSALKAYLDGWKVEQQIFGAKVRLFGDAVYDQDSYIPQVAVGVQYQRNMGISNAVGLTSVESIGARGTKSAEYYLAVTKIFLSESVLVNITLRYTNANQFGLLGFGGDINSNRTVVPEAALAFPLLSNVAIGIEYRDKPHNLKIDDEAPAWGAFIAWMITRNVSVTGAYANLGDVLGAVTHDTKAQAGAYLSLFVGF